MHLKVKETPLCDGTELLEDVVHERFPSQTFPFCEAVVLDNLFFSLLCSDPVF